jgi:aspartyl-tRNA(Asn)/glutamyl-tRNA(Gln) amidotransferase subunit A
VSSSIESYQEAIIGGRASVEKSTREELRNIEGYSGKLNAFVTIFSGEKGSAMSRARLLDSGATHAKLPPLHGVPITIKDNIFMAGFPTTDGSVPFTRFVPASNADVVDRILELGCVPLGKTNLHELALGATATSSLGGPVLNPHDPARISGGSSGGSAVSVAKSKGALISLGSDTGGSVRIPAAFCGVCGFKPSLGLISAEGVFPLSATLDHLGLLTRTMPDMAIAFNAVTGRRPSRKNRKINALVPTSFFLDQADEHVSKNFWKGIDRMRKSDRFEIKEDKRPLNFKRFSWARGIIQLREASWFYEEIISTPKSRRTMHKDVLELLDKGRRVGMTAYMQAELRRIESIHAMTALLRGFDVMLVPTVQIVAPRIDEVVGRETGDVRPILLKNTQLFNLCGFPALSLPTNAGSAALPTSLQIIGRFGEDDTVVQAGGASWDAMYGPS